MAGNDTLAVGCYAALDEAGLRCPDDISVMGFNDLPFVDRVRPPLTTVRFPHYQLGTEAAQLLLERIGQHDAPVKILYLAPELVVRESAAASVSAIPTRICWDLCTWFRRERGSGFSILPRRNWRVAALITSTSRSPSAAITILEADSMTIRIG